MAFPDNNLDLFELADTTLARINEKGKVTLNNYDMSFHFTKDSNQLDAQLNFQLFIFGEEFSTSTYSKKYNTEDKIVKLLLRNLKSEYMYKDVREGLIFTKIKSLKNQLYETIKAVKCKIASLNDNSERGVMIDIEELKSNKQKEKNGMPFFALTVKCRPKKIDVSIPIASNVSDWEQTTILEAIEAQLAVD